MIAVESTLLPLERERELSSECDKDKWGLIVNEQRARGSVAGKLPRGDNKVGGFLPT